MLKRLRISNYRSLAPDVDLELGKLTALVGQNGSGKSNVTDALQFLSDCMRLGLEAAITKRHGIDAVRRWSPGHPYNLAIEVETKNENLLASYRFVIGGDKAADYRVTHEAASVYLDGQQHQLEVASGAWKKQPPDLSPRVDPQSLVLPLVAGDERFRPLAETLRKLRIYSIFPDALRRPQTFDPSKPMDEHGGNWVSTLKDPEAEGWKNDLLAALGQLTGDIENIAIRSAGGYLIARFKHASESRRGKWFDSAQESDGTLRVAGLLTALLQGGSLPLVGIEEPELTVHPGAIPLVCDFIREASDRTQVLLTTHSPDLLDQLRVDEVRVVERRDGATTVGRLDDQQLDAVRSQLMSLGEVLRTEGLRQQQLPLPIG